MKQPKKIYNKTTDPIVNYKLPDNKHFCCNVPGCKGIMSWVKRGIYQCGVIATHIEHSKRNLTKYGRITE